MSTLALQVKRIVTFVLVRPRPLVIPSALHVDHGPRQIEWIQLHFIKLDSAVQNVNIFVQILVLVVYEIGLVAELKDEALGALELDPVFRGRVPTLPRPIEIIKRLNRFAHPLDVPRTEIYCFGLSITAHY